ncbi:MAG: sulfatase-like hydrolase/transferase, partial [Thermomicrobiales bacterium]
GGLYGQHRLPAAKGLPYDGAIRIPMLAWGKPFKARTVSKLTSHADLAPTIADLAGTEMPAADGQSLLKNFSRDYVPLQVLNGVHSAGGFGLRSSQLMYCEFASGEREYYDLRNDPLELSNMLATNGPPDPFIPMDLPRPEELNARLAQLKRCRGMTCR